MYARIKFNTIGAQSGHNEYSDGTNTRSIVQWIQLFLQGTVSAAQLPSAMVDTSLTTRVGSLPSEYTINYQTYTGTTNSTRWASNFLEIQKQHSQNSNFSSTMRIYQNGYYSYGVFQPRYMSSNGTNFVPNGVDGDSTWFSSTTGVDGSELYGPRYFGDAELQFFISEHWFIWTIQMADGSGGSAAIFDVESTGLDTFARSLNSLYSPQVFTSAFGDQWPTATSDQVTELGYGSRIAIYANQMYGGGNTFVNRGRLGWYTNNDSAVYGLEQIGLWPQPTDTVFNGVDDIGDTQNYLIPVYFYPTNHSSSNNSDGDRILLQGRIPYLWRTTDNAGQTGQTTTIGGVEYRFVRLHPCGSTGLSNVNAATYLVPTTIGGV